MTIKNSRRAGSAAAGVKSADLLPRMHDLFAALADLDRAYLGDIETVRNSETPEVLKQEVLNTLKARHRERRAFYVRQLEDGEVRAVPAA